ncbi:MAG TPA: exopolysaccharide biosynthesis polyprenyl glycosylphosphotransferase [Terriglobia bacterium]|nr:exopolysaccharide biosynthesis polyprenyl glycosylphosphotransferase [Terriglobia bacterium]
MIRRRHNYLNFCLRLVILLLPLFAFASAGWLRFGSGLIPLKDTNVDPADYFGLLFFTTLVWSVVVDQFGLARLDVLYSARTAAWDAVRACGITYVAVVGATFFYRSSSFSRLFVSLSAAALFLLLMLAGWGFRKVLDRARRNPKNPARILIIGADEFAKRSAQSVLDRLVMPSVVGAFVRLADQDAAAGLGPVIELGDVRTLGELGEFDDVVIAVPPARLGEVPGILKTLEPLSLPVRAILDLGEGVVVRDILFDLNGLRMLDLRASPSESVVYLVAKRALDLGVSTFVLVLTGPLMVVVAVLIRLTSPGPVMFAQDRVGLNGRIFRMFKFRTMRLGDTDESDTRWTTADDPRRTWLGALLRRTNLDELPQFFNVLKGEMSIVGPRPERPYFVQKFLEDVAQYNTRHYLKVGITGWAQVNGWRGDTSIPRRIEHDLYYLRHWSLAFDLKIMFLTVWRTLVANRNAY